MWKLWKSPDDAALLPLKSEIRQLRAELEALQLEWVTTQKKLQRLVGHIVKTAAIDGALQASAPATAEKPNGPIDVVDTLTRDQIANLRF